MNLLPTPNWINNYYQVWSVIYQMALVLQKWDVFYGVLKEIRFSLNAMCKRNTNLITQRNLPEKGSMHQCDTAKWTYENSMSSNPKCTLKMLVSLAVRWLHHAVWPVTFMFRFRKRYKIFTASYPTVYGYRVSSARYPWP